MAPDRRYWPRRLRRDGYGHPLGGGYDEVHPEDGVDPQVLREERERIWEAHRRASREAQASLPGKVAAMQAATRARRAAEDEG